MPVNWNQKSFSYMSDNVLKVVPAPEAKASPETSTPGDVAHAMD